MRAFLTTGVRQMRLVELPRPEPGPGQALIRVEAVGLCGSDLHIYTGDHPYTRYPQTQGHEFAGTIVAFGEDYHGPLRIGERVAVEPLIGCGRCYPCRNGRPNCCTNLVVLGVQAPGALAEFIAVSTSQLYPVGELDAELAALAEPLSIGVQAVTRAQVHAGEQVLIFGAGPIGQAVLLACKARGASTMIVDRLGSRLELAGRLGADQVALAQEETLADRLLSWTGGDGPAVIFEATGVPAVIRQAVELVASAGRIVIIGLSNQEVALPVVEFTRKELTILGSRNNAGVFAQAVALLQKQPEHVRALITHRFPFEETQTALEFALAYPDAVEKVIIKVAQS
ncbi:zinc-binding alcohol dehydrogenase family protein [Thermogemmatispora sp.]|uniref:zinc-binding alcohol dehydrogenase family protein n=1 Tax=Thermogemmatispora sp. TaxID=1968838 RepID=UPI0035E416FD